MSSNPLDMVIGSSSGPRDQLAFGTHVAKAREAEESGDRSLMVAELRKAVAADPSDVDTSFKLAYQLDLLGEEEEAIALYERCCERAPAPVNALINLSVLYEDRGDYVRAERCLRQVLDTDPNHTRARLFMKDVQASREMVLEEDQDRDLLKRKALMDTPVTDFELSVRARTCLKKMNIRTLGDLLRITEAELMSYKNFGESSLEEIKKMLATKGLKLGQGLEDAHRAARRQIMERLKGTGKEALLNKTVSDLQLSVRARKALQLLNIQTLGDLVSHTEAELMGVKNFGATSLVEVKQKLVELGLELRTLTEEEHAELVARGKLPGMSPGFGEGAIDFASFGGEPEAPTPPGPLHEPGISTGEMLGGGDAGALDGPRAEGGGEPDEPSAELPKSVSDQIQAAMSGLMGADLGDTHAGGGEEDGLDADPRRIEADEAAADPGMHPGDEVDEADKPGDA